MEKDTEKLFLIMCKYLENEEQRLRNSFKKTLIRYIVFSITAIIVVAIICFSPTEKTNCSSKTSYITNSKIIDTRR